MQNETDGRTQKICTCGCHVPGVAMMHMVPCCGPGSQRPDVSPPDSLRAYESMKNKKDAAITRLRALLQKAHDEFAKTDHWYHSDIKDELAKELGL